MDSKDNLFNLIITLYIGFFIIYLTAPVPKILYKKIISSPNDSNQVNKCSA